MIVRTDRLVLRPPVEADADAVLDYLNDPEVAEMQDWDLPQTADMVLQNIRASAAFGGPTPGEWVNLTIEADGQCIGHVACHLDATSAVAEVGYTLARAQWGKGYASEALGALIDHLMATTPVHRFVASLDPRNVRSMRVLEGAGFTMESLSRESYPMRGGWEDDLRYAMTPGERTAWQQRPTTPPTSVELVPVEATTAWIWARTVTHYSQQRLVQPLTRTFRDLAFPPVYGGVPATLVLRGVLADGQRVGTVLWCEPWTDQPEVLLWRIIVDRMHQRRRIGSEAIAQLQALLHAQGHRSMLVMYMHAIGGPERFYAGLGFVNTGRQRGPLVEARLSW